MTNWLFGKSTSVFMLLVYIASLNILREWGYGLIPIASYVAICLVASLLELGARHLWKVQP